MHVVLIVDGAVLWRDHADPEPGHGELLVRVRAAGLNGADMMQRKGLYPAPPDAPADIPGFSSQARSSRSGRQQRASGSGTR